MSPSLCGNFAENLCRMLVDAIKDGSEEKSSKLAVILAKRKSKLAIPEINDEVENKGVETSIKVTVHVEHKQCKSPTLIKLDVDPNKTDIFALKKLVSTISLTDALCLVF